MPKRNDAYELLKKMIHLSTSSLPLDEKLNQMGQAIEAAFRAERTLFLSQDRMAEESLLGRWASERKPFWIEEGSPLLQEKVLVTEKDFPHPPLLCLPLFRGDTFLGLLLIRFPEDQAPPSEEMDLLVPVAEKVTEAIWSSHLEREVNQTCSELAALHEMGKVAVSTLRLEELLKSVGETGLRILRAGGGVLRVVDKSSGELRVRWSSGNYDNNLLDQRIARRVFITQTPFLLNHSGRENPVHSILCVPLRSKGGVLGTLTFYDKQVHPSKFSETDFQLLLTMANQISFAIENALIHRETSRLARENEKRVRELSTLWELSKALLTTVNFDEIIRMTLTAITIGAGLGFNRAMLFMVNERTGALEGMTAVGPDNAEEAGRIWASLPQGKGILPELIRQLRRDQDTNCALNRLVSGTQIPLDRKSCILVKTALEAKPFNIRIPDEEAADRRGCERGCPVGQEVGCSMGGRLSRDPRVYSFATVPLWGKGRVIGVIVVDNLYNRQPITEEDIQILVMFSTQAGLAIENAMLFRNLEEVHQRLKETQAFLVHQEKMAALGELSSTVAHEIRNPLVSIGGFARRLYRSIPEDAPEKRYTQTIMTEVSRLERIISDLLHYTRREPAVFGEVDLQEVLEESLSSASERLDGGEIELVKEYPPSIPKVKGDRQQLIQAFSNLFENAYEAMKGKGTLWLRVQPFTKNGSPSVRIEVEDTAGGIDPENLHNIFNPFYSTKESRLGLGLPLVYKIITSHHGLLEVDNHPGEGVTFIITLPAAPEGK